MDTPFTYIGGKAVTGKKICEHLPTHLPTYIEPFFGAGGIFFRRPKAPTEYINDINGTIINFYEMLRDYPQELQERCEYSPYSRQLYYQVINLPEIEANSKENKIELAWRFWIKARQGRSASDKSGWRHSEKGNRPYSNNATSTAKRCSREYFNAIHERLKGVTIDNRDAITVIERCNRHNQSLLYCDPPYIRSTRFDKLYTHEYDDEDHIELLKTIRQFNGLVAISGYAHEIYDEILHDWRRIQFRAPASASKKKKSNTEVLWMNYDELFQPIQQSNS